MATLFLVELHFSGIGKGITHSPEDRVITSIHRLSAKEKNRLQYFKVKFYRILDRYCVFRLRDKYVLSTRGLVEVEKEFRKIYAEFISLRSEIYTRLVSDWPNLAERLKAYAVRFGIQPERVDALKPKDPSEFLEMSYSITPLPQLLEQLKSLVSEFESKGEDYQQLAERVKRENQKILDEIKQKYEEKIKQLEALVDELKKALKKSERKSYELRLRLGEVAEEASEIASLLGEETEEDLKYRLESLKSYFIEGGEVV